MVEKNNCSVGNENEFVDNLLIVARWVAASLAGKLTEEESVRLEKWCQEDARNLRLYKKILNEENRRIKREQFVSFKKDAGWHGYLEKRAKKGRTSLRWRGIMRYAAIFLIPLCVVYYFAREMGPDATLPLVENSPIVPGGPRAELLLASGQKIDLLSKSGSIASAEGIIVHNMEHQLSYRDTTNVALVDTILYNEVFVPKGGEYRLELSDGTLVFLNSMTKIRFPMRFSGDRREVELEGEAYFEVVKNEGKPFVVKTACYDVTVLGTRFNIIAYEDENITTTTLVEGAVVLSGSGTWERMRLQPNEQFILNKATRETKVQRVDASYFIAWKDGKFRFRDVRLEDIMRVVERWYDVAVVYEDEEIKDLRFGFNMSRHETIEPLLDIFELNGKVKISKEGRVLKVKRGR